MYLNVRKNKLNKKQNLLSNSYKYFSVNEPLKPMTLLKFKLLILIQIEFNDSGMKSK